MDSRLYTCIGGDHGHLQVTAMRTLAGAPLAAVQRLQIHSGPNAPTGGSIWTLRGVTSHVRYATRPEHDALAARQAALGRPDATRGALIPIRKSPAWWGMTQDERRAIFEETSGHIAIGTKYLPAIARRLIHCRDLGEDAPFDFLTLFDFPPSAAAAFDDLLLALRATPEWRYVEREVDIRWAR